MKQLLRVLGVVLIVFVGYGVSCAQSSREGWGMYNNARKMGEQAKSKEDFLKAKDKFQQALKIFEQSNDQKGIARTLHSIAFIEDKFGNYAKALEYYEKSLPIFRKIGDVKGEGVTLNNIGLVYNSWGQYSKALEYYEKALEIMRRLGDAQQEGAILNNIAEAYDAAGNTVKALVYYEECLTIQSKLGDVQGQEVTLEKIAELYERLHQYTRALESYEKVLEIKKKTGDVFGKGGALGSIARLYRSSGKDEKASEFFEKALKSYEEARLIAEKNGDNKLESLAVNQIATVYKDLGYHEKALEHYEMLLQLVQKDGDLRRESFILKEIGSVYVSLGDHEKAAEFFQKSKGVMKSKRVKKKGGEVKTKASIFMDTGSSHKAKSNYAEALAFYENALEITRKDGDLKQEGKALNLIGTVYQALGQYAKAQEFYEKSREISKEIRDVAGEGTALNNIAMTYEAMGRYSDALKFLENSLAMSRRVSDVSGEASTLNNIGLVYTLLGQYATALAFYDKSLGINQNLGNIDGEATTLINIGAVHRRWGQYAKALEFYQRALGKTQEAGNIAHEAGTLNNIAELYGSLGYYAKALEYSEKSLGMTRISGDLRQQGVGILGIANVHMAMGKYDDALAGFEKTLEMYARMEVPTDEVKDSIGQAYLEMGDLTRAEVFFKEASYNSSLGMLSLRKSDFKQAQTHYEKVLKKAEENRNSNNLFTAYTGLGRVYDSLQDYPKAEEYYRKAVNGVEEMRSGLGPSERENFFTVKTKGFYRTDPYKGLARVLSKLNRPVEALKQSEYTKARLFSEALSRRMEGTRIDVSRDILEKDSSLNDQLAALTKNLQQAYDKNNKEVISVLEPQVKDMKAKLAAHVDMLRKQYPLFAATRYPQPMDLTQTAVRDDEWVLEYDVTDSGVLIYLTKAKTLVKGLFKPVTKKDLEELVRKVREPLEVIPGKDKVSDKLKTFDLVAAKRLSDLLLADILPDLPKGAPVIIVPDDCLGIVPFEMLVLNSGGEIKTDRQVPYTSGVEFFGDRNSLSYYQSITALTLARTLGKQKKTQEKLLVIADPVFQMKDARAQERRSSTKLAGVEARLYEDLMASVEEGKVGGLRFSRLPLTGDLADDLNKSFKGSCTLYTGLKANKDTFMKEIVPSLSDYSKVVFATHGYAGKGLPGINEPVIVFSLVPPGTDGYLRMSEVMGLQMNADMVALTACQTGLGKELSGEGVMGMGRAFQFAGAKSVLMSLWSVSEKSSTSMVESFFRNLKEGKSKLEALKLAREEIRKQGFDHPFFWAPFILVGEVN
ncbi:MAG: tetratricopeptide repeat protein [Deltaproteobacteria bacterium]|nr:tetratricopeptide repeat protein [Deltaproteobacteria bacterium]